VSGQATLHIRHESDAGGARRVASRIAEHAGLPSVRVATVALIATELATNLSRHAQEGELVVQAFRVDGAPVVELISVDHGPGMADVGRCLADGFSTAGSMGAGLGGVGRMADVFDVYSRPSWGTVLLARVGDGEKRLPGRFEWGCVSLPARNEQVCGDSWNVTVQDNLLSVMVADGLGHGPLAAEAAQAAEQLFAREAGTDLELFLEQAHAALSRTRGAAISVARGSGAGERLSFAGVGNVSGSIVDAHERRGLAAHNGTIGVALPHLQTFEYDWPAHALVVLHSDGLRSRWSLRDYPGLHARHPAIVAAALHRDHRRAHDDATVLVARRRAA
jgi:anti-sigma regulatory factor (Ser/Thr protein kinase)